MTDIARPDIRPAFAGQNASLDAKVWYNMRKKKAAADICSTSFKIQREVQASWLQLA